MINLGDVNFSLGADTARLQQSINQLNRFGNLVNRVAASQIQNSGRITSALLRQEKAAESAFMRMQRLNQSMSKMAGSEQYIRRNEAAFERLNRAMTSGQLTALGFQRAQSRFNQSLHASQIGLKNHTSSMLTATGANRGLINGLENLATGLVLVNGPLGGMATRVVGLTSVLKRGTVELALFVAGAATAVYTIAKLGGTVLDAGRKMKGFEAQFQAVSGSIIGSWNQIAQATQTAKLTGTLIEEIVPAMAKFQAAAKGTGIASKDVKDVFESIAFASTKLQLSADQTSGIFRALEQMMSKGTVQAEELRGQLGDRLYGAFNIAARGMGITTAKLGELMKKGLVPTAEFLPKFAAEVRKTFNIDGSPIDNYTSAVNNMRNAWFELRVEIDNQLGVTNKVMQFYKNVTGALDYLRENLSSVKIGIMGVGGALTGLVAPSVISGLLYVTKAIFSFGTGMRTLNALFMALPLGRVISMFVRLAAIVGGAIAGLTAYKDEIILVKGAYATLGDYQREIWSQMEGSVNDAISQIKSYFATVETPWQALNDRLKEISNLTWPEIITIAKRELTSLVDAFRQALNEIQIYWGAFQNNIGVGFQQIAKYAKSVDDFFGPWTRSIEEQRNPSAKWYDEIIDKGTLVYQSIDQTNRQIDAMKNNLESSNIGDKFEKWAIDLHNAANEAGKMRQVGSFRQSELQTWGQTFESLPKGQSGGPKIAPEVDEKTLKKLQKQKDAIDAINKAIEDTYETVDALGGTDAGLKSLTDQFKREKEVEKYAKAMRKAGVETSIVAEKSQQLMHVLEMQDMAERAREVAEIWQDTWVDAFDSISNSLVDSMLNGGNAMENLKNVARDVAQDIFKTFLQLSLMNPLKNMLFGTNLPTSGNILGALGIGGGAAAASAFSFAPGMGLWRKGGISHTPIVKYAKNGMINSPTKFMTSQGPVIGGEAGREAIMPLHKDASGALGIKAVGGGGSDNRSVISIQLSPELIAQVLKQAASQSIEVSTEAVKGFAKSPEFEARVLTGVKKAGSTRNLK